MDRLVPQQEAGKQLKLKMVNTAVFVGALLVAFASARTDVYPYAYSSCNYNGCKSILTIYSSGFGKGATRKEAVTACKADCSQIFDNSYYQDSDSTSVCLALCGVQPNQRSITATTPETCVLCAGEVDVIGDCSKRIEEQVANCKSRCAKAVTKKGGSYISFAPKATTTNIEYAGDKSQCDDDPYNGY